MHPLRRLRVLLPLLALGALAALPARAAGPAPENPGSEGDGEFTIGPDYSTDKDLTDLGAPKGKSFEFKMPLAASKIFRGDDQTLSPRRRLSAPSARSPSTSPRPTRTARRPLSSSSTMAPAS